MSLTIRRLLQSTAATIAATLATTTLTVAPAYAGPDSGMCKSDNSRANIPENFVLSACFDGEYLYLANHGEDPVMAYADGGGVPVSNGTKGGNLATQALIIANLKENRLLPPGWRSKIHIGQNKADVKVKAVSDKILLQFLVASLVGELPIPLFQMGSSIAHFVVEYVDVTDQYDNCMERNHGDKINNRIARAGCMTLHARNVSYAGGRAVANIAGSADLRAKHLKTLTDFGMEWAKGGAKWEALRQYHRMLEGGDTKFSITAATKPQEQAQPSKPVAEAPDTNTKPMPNNDKITEPENTNHNDGPPLIKTATITIQNKHLDGPSALVEESSPMYLFGEMRPRCWSNGCGVSGTNNLWSGSTLTARCIGYGSQMTNENLGYAGDDANPHKATSTLWYRAVWGDGREGWVSEVFVVANDRGGKDLPNC